MRESGLCCTRVAEQESACGVGLGFLREMTMCDMLDRKIQGCLVVSGVPWTVDCPWRHQPINVLRSVCVVRSLLRDGGTMSNINACHAYVHVNVC